ncbi:amidohydrolase [Bacillus sp. FJAT-47783]|uniref:amidohydrolase n=1 Tax=Bacillus sp. FJAT-47783 TaxID=2922712 RepID=UPI001FAD2BFA|nr:amidohydrolase [Bacillus sp. FJAT-47783]
MKTLVTNGTIYTMNHRDDVVEAIVVEGGKIVDTGSYEEMKLRYSSSITNTIDLQGKMAIPGLTDSHMHLSGVAGNFMELNLTGVQSKEEMLSKIKEKASSLHPGEWVLGRGWDENLFRDRSIPTMDELDHVSPNNPLFLGRICGHAYLANRLAFKRCHVDNMSSLPPGGEIALDEYTKQPTGLILETASQLFTKHIPNKSYEQLKQALYKAMDYCMELGLTSIHTNDPLYLGGFEQTYRLYHELLNEEQVGLRTNLLIDYPFLDELKERQMLTGFGNDMLQIGAIKIFADGALGRRTALLSKPYEDDPDNFGKAIHDEAELFHIIQSIRQLQLPVAVHTIGDQAVENVLHVLDQFPNANKRDRIIHASILREDLIERLVHPRRIVDVQPRFIVSDFPWIIDRIGEERVKYAYPFKTMRQKGVLCAGGSDAPIEPVDPLLSIHAAVARRIKEETHEGYIPTEKLSTKEAIHMYTLGGAYATNEEHKKGTLERGKLADLTVLSQNIFTLKNADELLETKVEMTIIGGKVTYSRIS